MCDRSKRESFWVRGQSGCPFGYAVKAGVLFGCAVKTDMVSQSLCHTGPAGIDTAKEDRVSGI
jgi:hypothetical protein